MHRKLPLALTTAAASLLTAWWLGASATHLDLASTAPATLPTVDSPPAQPGDVETAVFAVG